MLGQQQKQFDVLEVNAVVVRYVRDDRVQIFTGLLQGNVVVAADPVLRRRARFEKAVSPDFCTKMDLYSTCSIPLACFGLATTATPW